MNFAHNFTRGAASNRPQVPLTLDQLRAIAPSAFATEKHESRSDRYTYVPTVAVIEGMMKAGFQPFKASQSRSRIEGKSEFTKHMIRFRQESQTALVVGDTVPEVVLINSHDGTSTYQLSAGFYRLVCSNGLMVAQGTQDEVKVPHKGNIIDLVIDGSNRIVNGSGLAIAEIEAWRGLELTAGEQKLFAEAAHTVRFQEPDGAVKTPITVEQLLKPRRDADAANGSMYARNGSAMPAPDLWRTFNVIQENVIRGGLSNRGADTTNDRGRRVRGRMVTTREVRGIDQDVKLNRALWTLAEKMAELKGVSVAA